MSENNSIHNLDRDNLSRNETQVERTQFSFYRQPVRNTTPSKVMTLWEVYQEIKSNRYKWQTDKLRTIKDPILARDFKANRFPYVTFSGTFTKRSNSSLIKHSELMALDFDHVPDVNELKKSLLADKNFETELFFRSPSGDGGKWVVPIDLKQGTHLEYFLAISNYIKAKYDVVIDPNTKDVSRACFCCFDEEVFINPKHIQ